MSSVLLAAVVLLGFQDAGAAPSPDQAPAPEAAPESLPQGTPEDAYRSFLLAMLTKDEKGLRALVLSNDEAPVSDDDFAWLLRGEDPPLLARAMMKTMIPRQTVERLAVGDLVVLPGGREIRVEPAEVSDTRAVVRGEGTPVPTRCWKVDDLWKVDARPVIAGRKAADAARRRAEAQRKAAEKGADPGSQDDASGPANP